MLLGQLIASVHAPLCQRWALRAAPGGQGAVETVPRAGLEGGGAETLDGLQPQR